MILHSSSLFDARDDRPQGPMVPQLCCQRSELTEHVFKAHLHDVIKHTQTRAPQQNQLTQSRHQVVSVRTL